MSILALSQPYLRKKNAFPYITVTPPANLPVTLDQVKMQLNIALSDTSKDVYLTMLIQAATDFGQKYTKLTFIDTTFRTYRNTFYDALDIRRAPVSAINSIQYLKDSVLTLVAGSVYGFTASNYFPDIFLLEGQQWPSDVDRIPQAIQIEFVAGFGVDESSVPADIKLALLQHITMMYSDRGDCSCDAANSLPATAQALYDKVRIMDITSPSNVNQGYIS